MIYEHFRATDAHEAALFVSDLFTVSVLGDDIQDFDTRWDQSQISTSEISTENVLESLCKMRLRECAQRHTVLAMFEQEIEIEQCQGIKNWRPW